MAEPPDKPSILESIRQRPAMYVGGLGELGLHHMVFWAVDDIVANARAGRGAMLHVWIHDDGSCSIVDEGPPSHEEVVDMDRLTEDMPVGGDRGLPAPQQVRSYLPVLRALSTRLEVTWTNEGTLDERVTYEGIHDKVQRERVSPEGPDAFSVRFWPDPEVLGVAFPKSLDFDFDLIRTRMREVAATWPEIDLRLNDEVIAAPDGMADMVRGMAKSPARHFTFPSQPFRLRVHTDLCSFDVAIQWYNGVGNVASWANTVRTKDGSHVLGLKESLRAGGLADVSSLAAISVFSPQPRFTNPVKDCLHDPHVRQVVRDHTTVALRRFVQKDEGFALKFERARER